MLVPLIPGVLMLRLMFTAIATEKALEQERTEELYRQALRIARPSLAAHLQTLPPDEATLPGQVVSFYERSFGDEINAVVTRENVVVAGKRPRGQPPLATAVLPLPDYQVEIYAAAGSDPEAEAADQIRRFIWSSGVGLGLALTIAALAALAVNRRLQVRELESNSLATVAHEMKTPLASSRILLETLLDDRVRDETQRREYLEILSRENARLAHVVEAFLISGRLQHGLATAELVDLETLVRTEANDRITLKLEPDLPAVRGDAGALATAFGNLVANALKFSNGAVRVEGKRMDRMVALAVTDEGIGIARRDQKRIFERFEQVNRKLSRVTEGCGLGLSIVREIATAHGGRVEVRSAIGQGSTFTLFLPVADSSDA